MNASGVEMCLPLAPHAYWDSDFLPPNMLNEMMHIQLTSIGLKGKEFTTGFLISVM